MYILDVCITYDMYKLPRIYTLHTHVYLRICICTYTIYPYTNLPLLRYVTDTPENLFGIKGQTTGNFQASLKQLSTDCLSFLGLVLVKVPTDEPKTKEPVVYGFVKLESSRAVRIKTGASLHLSEIAESLAEVLKSKENQQRLRDSLVIPATNNNNNSNNNNTNINSTTTTNNSTTTTATALPPIPEDTILSPSETLNKAATVVESDTSNPASTTPTTTNTNTDTKTTRPPTSLLSRLSTKLLPSSLISTLSSSSLTLPPPLPLSTTTTPSQLNQISLNSTPSPVAPVAPVRGGSSSGDPSGITVPVLQLDDLESTLKPLRYYR